MKNIIKGLLLTLIAFQLVSCGSEDSVEPSVAVDEILKGIVTSVGNTPPTGSIALGPRFTTPVDVAVDQNGDIYVADINDKTIKKVITSDGTNTVTTFAGNNTARDIDGIGTAASFAYPQTLTFSKDYKTLYIGSWYAIRAIDIATKTVTTLAGGSVWGGTDGAGTAAKFTLPQDIVLNTSGTTMYVTEHSRGIAVVSRIRKIDIASKQVTTLTWNNLPTGFIPQHMIVDSKDENLYLANNYKSILKMNLQTKNVTVFAGSNTIQATTDGIGEDARFDLVRSLAFSSNETYLYAAQKGAVRAINMNTKEVTTVGGNGSIGFVNGDTSTARFNFTYGMSYDKTSNKLYVADRDNKAIRVIK